MQVVTRVRAKVITRVEAKVITRVGAIPIPISGVVTEATAATRTTSIVIVFMGVRTEKKRVKPETNRKTKKWNKTENKISKEVGSLPWTKIPHTCARRIWVMTR